MKAKDTLKIASSLVNGDRAKKHGDMFHSHDLSQSCGVVKSDFHFHRTYAKRYAHHSADCVRCTAYVEQTLLMLIAFHPHSDLFLL
jgi:hypothetical protein